MRRRRKMENRHAKELRTPQYKPRRVEKKSPQQERKLIRMKHILRGVNDE